MKNSQQENSIKKLCCKTESELINALRISPHLDCTIFDFNTSNVRLIDYEPVVDFQDGDLVIPKHFKNISYLSSCFLIEYVLLPKKLRVLYHELTVACLTQFEMGKYLEHITIKFDYWGHRMSHAKKISKTAKNVSYIGRIVANFIPKGVTKLKCALLLDKLFLPKKLTYLETYDFNKIFSLPKQLKHLILCKTSAHVHLCTNAIITECLETLVLNGKNANTTIDLAICEINKLIVHSTFPKIINLPNNLINIIKTPDMVIYTN